MKKITMLISLVALFVWCGSALAGYTITDLGTLNSSRKVYASSINDKGQVAGYYIDAEGTYNAYLYSNGVMNDLGSLGGSYTTATSINNSGQVVISTTTSNQYSYLYSNGTMTNLGYVSGSYGINDKGQITGWYNGPNGNNAFIYSSGTLTNLPTLGAAPSTGYAINDSSLVAGTTFVASGNSHGFLYSNGTIIDLGTLPGGANSDAYGINNTGQIVGRSSSSSGVHAFLYENGAMVDLNSLLPTNSGWTLQTAKDINNLGQITGYGKINGVVHAFIMTPDVTPTPIPAAAWLLGSGVLGLLGLKRRKLTV